jgi:hypothetical protein
MEYKYKIKLPPISTFKSRSKKLDPYSKFYRWILKELMPNLELYYNIDALGFPQIPGTRINVSAFWFTHSDYNKLESIAADWCEMKDHDRVDVTWLNFDIGPASFDKGDKSHQQGYVYICSDFLTKVNNE